MSTILLRLVCEAGCVLGRVTRQGDTHYVLLENANIVSTGDGAERRRQREFFSLEEPGDGESGLRFTSCRHHQGRVVDVDALRQRVAAVERGDAGTRRGMPYVVPVVSNPW